jgi:hypothetical protein
MSQLILEFKKLLTNKNNSNLEILNSLEKHADTPNTDKKSDQPKILNDIDSPSENISNLNKSINCDLKNTK